MSTASVQTLLQQMPQWRQQCAPGAWPALQALQNCRTPALGYHLYGCNRANCENKQMQYHSCRNRHCPNCGSSKQEEWVQARMRELIPCKYYHVVFTLPHALNGIVMGNRKAMFNILFEAAHYTLHTFGKDPKYLGATAGIISVLHTWGQNLSFHPHVHCIVSGGGTTKTGDWVEAKKVKYGVLYPVQAMEMVYRGRFMHLLNKAVKQSEVLLPPSLDYAQLRQDLYAKRWVVFAKQPFGGPQQVVEYLGRYTHKVAISKHRIRDVDEQNRVTFGYKDYADGSKKKLMTLDGEEFLRRFEQHILPKGYCKIRSCGLYTNHGRKTRIAAILEQLDVPPHPPAVSVPWHLRMVEKTGKDPLLCPCCKLGRMLLLEIVRPAPWQSQVHKPPEC